MVGFNFDHGGRRCIRSILEKYQSGKSKIYSCTKFTDNSLPYSHGSYFCILLKAKAKGTLLNQKMRTLQFRIIHWNKLIFSTNRNKG